MKLESPHKSQPATATILSVCLILGTVGGCGDEASRMAGTIDMPDRSKTKFDVKQATADAKARAKEAKAAKANSANR